MKHLVMTLSVLFALSAFAVPKDLDIRPVASKVPTAAVWQETGRINLDALTAPAVLQKHLATEKTRTALLDSVKPFNQLSDPWLLTQIAAVTQYVMTPGVDAKLRKVWAKSLMKAALKYQADPYQALFFIDQLRWCGTKAELYDLNRLKTKANRRETREAAGIAVGEISKTQK